MSDLGLWMQLAQFIGPNGVAMVLLLLNLILQLMNRKELQHQSVVLERITRSHAKHHPDEAAYIIMGKEPE